jgi:hypothetical protein
MCDFTPSLSFLFYYPNAEPDSEPDPYHSYHRVTDVPRKSTCDFTPSLSFLFDYPDMKPPGSGERAALVFAGTPQADAMVFGLKAIAFGSDTRL